MFPALVTHLSTQLSSVNYIHIVLQWIITFIPKTVHVTKPRLSIYRSLTFSLPPQPLATCTLVSLSLSLNESQIHSLWKWNQAVITYCCELFFSLNLTSSVLIPAQHRSKFASLCAKFSVVSEHHAVFIIYSSFDGHRLLHLCLEYRCCDHELCTWLQRPAFYSLVALVSFLLLW